MHVVRHYHSDVQLVSFVVIVNAATQNNVTCPVGKLRALLRNECNEVRFCSRVADAEDCGDRKSSSNSEVRCCDFNKNKKRQSHFGTKRPPRRPRRGGCPHPSGRARPGKVLGWYTREIPRRAALARPDEASGPTQVVVKDRKHRANKKMRRPQDRAGAFHL